MLCPCCNGKHWVVKDGRLQPCPECGGFGEVHCCDGLCEQPQPESEQQPSTNKPEHEP
jgi:hypothetical protein